jgi:prephenate dehydratase/chorismate mutase/prephenate dehydratase
MGELEELRTKINQTDAELLRLLNQRMELALRTRKLKSAIADPSREKEILESVKKQSYGLLNEKFSAKIYSDIIGESKRLQEQELKLAGFQGEHGAYSEVAMRCFDGQLVPTPCREFIDVFDGVTSRQLDCGVVPVENSLEGAVTQVNDLLIERELKIVGEIKIPIHHCLLTLPDTDYRDIKVVYSHPQALAQCRSFLNRNKLDARPFYDTAGAAMMLAKERPKAAAVISNGLCAEIYTLEILKENIEDHESNSTRFVMLAQEEAKENGNKCSIVFSTAHKAGALFSVLKVFSDAGINLTRIESRPIKKDPGKYAFLLDFQGSVNDKTVTNALEEVKEYTIMYKFLGCYKEREIG